MTERRKEYITDALGEVEDGFVAEAIEYKKERFHWRYTKELMTVAACAAVLFVSVNAVRMLPIGRSNETAAGAAEGKQEAAALENAVEEATPAENGSEAEQPVYSTEKQDATTDAVTNQNNITTVLGNESDKKIYSSKGIEWEEITAAEEKEEINELCGLPTIEAVQTSSCVEWLSAEELLARDTDIFMGNVINMQTYQVTGGMTEYFTVATVEIEDSIRGGRSVGDTCRIYLPYAEADGMTMTNSLIGDLDKLEIGSRAIFMPYKVTQYDGKGTGEVWLSYGDFAEYYFGEGMRFLFLETEDGTSYETDVYEVPGGSEASLEEIAEYIRGIIAE